ncbi:ARC5 [Scenedesmus sp. PABB004]|nr:ARC5 [Scenedesmus sp. PABB004]
MPRYSDGHIADEPELDDAPQPSAARRAGRAGADNSSTAETRERAERSSAHFVECASEHLYAAFQQLHLLAQDFEKPFDAPAILVVGHQTDGKSALVEALMGFQFNHVGGGTKTRRPITLHMKYNASAVQPVCFLLTEDCGESEVSLEELQEHIHDENARLEEEGQFWSKEIVVRIEYKYSPNLTIIDTPGLISAAPGRKNSALQTAARQVEAMVIAKMQQPEYIILCLEDSSDWNNATTRRTVMQVDPTLSRTVLVSTKFDTRLPQFSTPGDVEAFLRAPGLHNDVAMLGGSPFFTWAAPAPRGPGAAGARGFREAVAAREQKDIQELEGKLARKLDSVELCRLGVHQLRRFLEALLQRRYLDNVPAIVPLLDREHRVAEQRLTASRKELDQLATDKLRDKGRAFRETFLAKLALLLRGTVAAPSESFGETLEDEHLRGGAFMGPDAKPLVAQGKLPNAGMRLYGGAQFNRAMAEFRAGVGAMECPKVSREEIVNACGVGEMDDGVNYVRTACVIAVSKSKEIFEPLIHQLGYRLAHVLRRILPIAMYLLQKDGACLSGHDLLLRKVGDLYHTFIEETEGACKHRCLEDLLSTTRYVTWSLHTKSTKALRAILAKLQPDALRAATLGGGGGGAPSGGGGAQGGKHGGAQGGGGADAPGAASVMIDLLECTLWQRQLGTLSEEMVAALVAQVFEGIRDFIVQAVELKYNCFFLLETVDGFPQRLREQLEEAWEADLEGVFDVKAVRGALEARVKNLEAEKKQVERLQRKFGLIHSTLAQQATLQAAPSGVVKQSELNERMSLMSLSQSASLANLSKLRVPPSGASPWSAGGDARGARDTRPAPGVAAGSSGGGAGGELGGEPGAARARPGALDHAGPAARPGGAGGALAAAAAAAAAHKLTSLAAAGGKPLVQQAAAGGIAAGKPGGGAPGPQGEGALTKGVRAHAVALSAATLGGHS